MKVAIVGASGRMGRELVELSREVQNLELVGAVVSRGSSAEGCELVPGCLATADLESALRAADVYIDFSAPAATAAAARAAAATKTAAVVGTTGLGDDATRALAELAQVAPVLVAANFSPGMNLLLAIAEEAARALGPAFDLEVLETHHRRKRDAPSGSALALAGALARGRGLDPARALVRSRDGEPGPRRDDEIGVAALRGGDIVGEHTAYFIGAAETLELSHRASRRDVFARGALRAAAFVSAVPPGRYTMGDVLGISSGLPGV